MKVVGNVPGFVVSRLIPRSEFRVPHSFRKALLVPWLPDLPIRLGPAFQRSVPFAPLIRLRP
jgi:hypothetical protein